MAPLVSLSLAGLDAGVMKKVMCLRMYNEGKIKFSSAMEFNGSARTQGWVVTLTQWACGVASTSFCFFKTTAVFEKQL